MTENSKDWDLGQKLIEGGICSLDQIREVLSLQDRMRKMGAQPKPLARVLLERGFATRDQLLRAGVPENALPPSAETATQKLAERGYKVIPARRRAPSRAPIVIGLVVLAGLGALILYGRGFFSPPEAPKPVVLRPPIENEEAKEKLIEEQLSRIVSFQNSSANFENAEEVIKRYETFMKAQEGRKWELEAHRKLKEYRERADVFAKPELEAIRRRETDLRDQQRFAELLALYRKFPPRFLNVTESGRIAREKISELVQRIREIYVKEKAEAEKLARDGKYEDALVRVAALERVAATEQLPEVADLKALIERESRGAAMKVRQDIADKYFRVDGDFKQAMARRDGRLAASVVEAFVFAPWKEEQRPFVLVRGTDYAALRKAVQEWKPEEVAKLSEAAIPEADAPDKLGTGEAALLDLRNAALMALFMRDYLGQYQAALASKDAIELPSLGRGRFVKKDNRTIFLSDGGAELEPDTSPLQAPDLAALALRAGPADAAMHARIGVFYFYSAPNHPDKAYEHLVKADHLGARGVRPFLGGLATTVQAERARQLRTKFGAAQDCFKNRQWPQTKKLLGELLEYADHPFTQAVRPEIEKMLYDIAEGTEREKKLEVQYRGKVEAIDAATLRVTYDFEGKEQADAFEIVTEEAGRKFKGRWRAERGVMESSVEASVMRWKTPVKGDVALEYDLTPLEDPQNIVVDLYYNKGQTKHYAVVVGFDWVGKPDGDPANTIEDRFGMPRTCVIKYPVMVDKGRWVLDGEWENWKIRLAGKPFGEWKPAKGKTYRMRIERQGKSIRVNADKTLVWEGEDDEYKEGQLLFFSDCRCRLDNLSITFKSQ